MGGFLWDAPTSFGIVGRFELFDWKGGHCLIGSLLKTLGILGDSWGILLMLWKCGLAVMEWLSRHHRCISVERIGGGFFAILLGVFNGLMKWLNRPCPGIFVERIEKGLYGIWKKNSKNPFDWSPLVQMIQRSIGDSWKIPEGFLKDSWRILPHRGIIVMTGGPQRGPDWTIHHNHRCGSHPIPVFIILFGILLLVGVPAVSEGFFYGAHPQLETGRKMKKLGTIKRSGRGHPSQSGVVPVTFASK